MKIKVISISHTAPPAKSLKGYFIRGVTKTREFDSKIEILDHYNLFSDAKDIVRASSEVRYLYEPVLVKIRINNKDNDFVIPKCFVYDGESIGVLQKIAFRGSRIAALIHDYTYYKQMFDKKTCDNIMQEVQLYRGVPQPFPFIVNIGLKLFGKKSYEAYND